MDAPPAVAGVVDGDAILLLDRFRLLDDGEDTGPVLLRQTRSELSFRAVDSSLVVPADDRGEGAPAAAAPAPVVVLRFLSSQSQFESELSARDALRCGGGGCDDASILPVLAAFRDASAVESDWGLDRDDSSTKQQRRPKIAVSTRLDILRDTETALARLTVSSSDGPSSSSSSRSLLNAERLSYPYLLVHPVASVTSLRSCLADYPVRWDDRTLAGARHVASDVVDGLLGLHGQGVVHRNLSTGSVARTDDYGATACAGDDENDAARVEGGSSRRMARWRLSYLGSCVREDAPSPTPVAAEVGCEWGDAFPDWGCLPPGAAAMLLSGEEGGAQEASLLEQSTDLSSNPAWDLWSLGCVLFALVFKTELWQTDRDGRISQEDLAKLAGWTERDVWDRVLAAAKDFGDGDEWTDEETAAIDLVVKLLDPTPAGRFRHFELGIVSVRQHEFVEGQPLSPPNLAAFTGRRRLLTADRLDRDRHRLLTSSLDLTERWELTRSIDVLLLGAFEPPPHEVRVPTSFVIVRRPLPPDGTAGRNPEAALWEGVRWLKMFEAAAPHVRGALLQRDVRAIGRFWSAVEEAEDDSSHGVDKDPAADEGGGRDGYRYLYLVDDLTGEPVLPRTEDGASATIGSHGSPYPIPVKDRSDALPALLPLLHLTMRSAALRRGAAGVAKLFGAGSSGGDDPATSALSEDVRVACQEWIDDLKDENGKLAAGEDMFGSFIDDVDRASAEPRRGSEEERKFFFRDGRNVRSRSIEELARFLRRRGVVADPPGTGGGGAGARGDEKKEEEDYEEEDFAGLKRLADDDGRALWTTVSTSDAARRAVADRTADRLEEERNLWEDRRTAHRADELRSDLVRSREVLGDVLTRAGEETERADAAEKKIRGLREALEEARRELVAERRKLDVLERSEDRAKNLVKQLSDNLFFG